MKFEECKIGDKVKIIRAVFTGQSGTTEVINNSNDPEILYPIGVRLDPIPGKKILAPLTWFEPDALEKIE
ncbi:MAG: hypothetical protein JSU85_04965 [Candidatus Zixiibacteriota bacterium]|nr:MAG: hypothetical protein JSU85_04965 [candidate division Zixibacteria bacterium]